MTCSASVQIFRKGLLATIGCSEAGKLYIQGDSFLVVCDKHKKEFNPCIGNVDTEWEFVADCATCKDHPLTCKTYDCLKERN